MGQGGLTVNPSQANLYTDLDTGAYTYTILQAKYTNGTYPASVAWKTTNACVSTGTGTSSEMEVLCNFSCGDGTISATVTATDPQGRSGSAFVSCSWR